MMNKFLRNILGFFLLIFILSGIVSLIVPYHWGNPWYSAKIRHLESLPSHSYNTYFFGSSTFYRHIDPVVFDRHVNSHSNLNLQSYNMGALATFCPQSYYLFELFLESELSSNTKYCFLELRDLETIGDAVMHQERTSYWVNKSDLMFVFRSFIKRETLTLREKISASSKYLVSYLESIFHIGHFGKLITSENYYDQKLLGPEKDGFFPLQLDYSTSTDWEYKAHLEERIQSLQKNPAILEKRKTKDNEARGQPSNSYDHVHLDRVQELISKANDKNIHLIFLLSPRCASKEIISLSKQLESKHFINMAQPDLFSDLYLLENSFDRGHLNTKGAKIYSKYIAEQFMSTIE